MEPADLRVDFVARFAVAIGRAPKSASLAAASGMPAPASFGSLVEFVSFVSREHSPGAGIGGRGSQADISPGLEVRDGVDDPAAELAVNRARAVDAVFLQGPGR